MKNFFAPNLENRGRLVRGISGISLMVTGLLISGKVDWVCFALVACGGFVLYEAVRGWCIRACGIRTRL